MGTNEINKCSAYSGALFANTAFLTGVLSSALPYWITTRGTAFEFMNLGFWEYCKQIDLENTACYELVSDSSGVKKWLKDARITGCAAPVFLTFCWIFANLYTWPNRFQGSRRILAGMFFMGLSTIAFQVATMVLFCFGRDDHKFIEFEGPVQLSHSFYLAMACVTCLINTCMMMVADVLETRRRRKNAYTPPSAKFLEDLEREAARLRAEGAFDEFEREELYIVEEIEGAEMFQ